MGTVTSTHTRKNGKVWVKYPNNAKVYEVERHLIFGTAEAAEARLQKVRKGKTLPSPPPPPPPTKLANPPTNLQENLEPNQRTPTNAPNLGTATQGLRQHKTRKRGPERCNV